VSRKLRRLRRPLVALVALVAALAIGYAVSALRGDGHSGPVALSSLPPQVAQTVHLVEAGGPFPFREDGAVFLNAEGRLPDEPRGYYHEYTVVTLGSPDRGARRIVTGKNGEFYYTSDHYETFRRVDTTR